MSYPCLYVVRHGETEWTISGRHTGLTDIPLTERGEQKARGLVGRLSPLKFAAVFTSPLRRAARTCDLAGFGAVAVRESDLVEWNYGQFEGITSKQIRAGKPDWNLFRDGCPGGESLAQIAARADRFIAKVRAIDGDSLAFTSGHFTRVLVARWLGLDGAAGKHFVCETASVSVLGYEHSLDEPVVRLWNETRPV